MKKTYVQMRAQKEIEDFVQIKNAKKSIYVLSTERIEDFVQEKVEETIT